MRGRGPRGEPFKENGSSAHSKRDGVEKLAAGNSKNPESLKNPQRWWEQRETRLNSFGGI